MNDHSQEINVKAHLIVISGKQQAMLSNKKIRKYKNMLALLSNR
jgi:hypothetical protein